MSKSISANDAGLSDKFIQQRSSIVRKDGRFNVAIKGSYFWENSIYHFLLNLSWFKFTLLTFLVFIVINLGFAFIYMLCGVNAVSGIDHSSWNHAFLDNFFFSVHTFTTVGYGNMLPNNRLVNMITVIDVFIGILYTALATGVLFGRFSRPTSRIKFSSNFIIAPYKEGRALMFRVANARKNMLMDVGANLFIILKTSEGNRSFREVDLAPKQIVFFPLPWTIVHPITESSPLWGKTKEEIEAMQMELLVRIKAYDETFNQLVIQNYTYGPDALTYGGKFVLPFGVNKDGKTEIWLDKLNDFELVELPSYELELATQESID